MIWKKLQGVSSDDPEATQAQTQEKIAVVEARSAEKMAKTEARLKKWGIDLDEDEGNKALIRESPTVTGRITGLRYGASRFRDDDNGGARLHVVVRVEWPGTPEPIGYRLDCGSENRNLDISDLYPSSFRLGAGIDGIVTSEGPKLPSDFPIKRDTAPQQGLSGGADVRDSGSEKWPRALGTIVSWQNATKLGVTTTRRNITLRLPDGTLATTKASRVPAHVHAYVVPGAEVPVGLNPKNPAEAAIDWVTLAHERAEAGLAGHYADPAPEGSLAFERAARSGAPSGSMAAGVMTTLGSAGPLDDTDTIEGITYEQSVKIQLYLMMYRIKKKDQDRFASLEFGVPPGRYSDIAQQWMRRFYTDTRLHELNEQLQEKYGALAQQAALGDGWKWQERGDLDR